MYAYKNNSRQLLIAGYWGYWDLPEEVKKTNKQVQEVINKIFVFQGT